MKNYTYSSLTAGFLLALTQACPGQNLIPNQYGPGVVPFVFDVTGTAATSLVVAGVDTSTSGSLLSSFDGTSWTSLGFPGAAAPLSVAGSIGVPFPPPAIPANLVTGTTQGEVWQFDGAQWFNRGAIASTAILDVALAASGNIYACGQFLGGGSSLLEFDGTGWNPPGGGLSGVVARLDITATGDLLAGGQFQLPSGQLATVASFDGTTWTARPDPAPGLTCWVIRELPNGNLVGAFRTASSVNPTEIFEFDGSAWTSLGQVGGASEIWEIVALPIGDIVVTGLFSSVGGVAASNVARFGGTGWSAFGDTDGRVFAARFLPFSQQLAIAGEFNTVGTSPESNVAGFGPGLAGSTATVVAGCAGSTVIPLNMPMAGETYAALALNMAGPIGISVVGLTQLTPPLPLSAVFPNSPIGCDLNVSPDITLTLLPTGGPTFAGFPIAADPALVGATIFHQVVDLQPNNVATSTNMQSLTIGSF